MIPFNIVGIVTITTILGITESLRCYVCSSEADSDCIPNPTSVSNILCPTDYHCYKIDHNDDSVSRGCSDDQSDCLDESMQQNETALELIDVRYCCFSDNCNHSNTVLPALPLVYLVPIGCYILSVLMAEYS